MLRCFVVPDIILGYVMLRCFVVPDIILGYVMLRYVFLWSCLS